MHSLHLNQKLAILLYILVSSILLLFLLCLHGHVDIDTELLTVGDSEEGEGSRVMGQKVTGRS